jgi:hypothetical protein
VTSTRGRCRYRRRHELADVATVGCDLAHQRRRNVGKIFRRRQKHRFDFRCQHAVHAHQLEFVFEVGHRAQPAQDQRGILLLHELGQKAGKTAHLDIGNMRQHFAAQLNTVVHRHAAGLLHAGADTDDDTIKDAHGAFDQVGMAVGDRVEGAGIDDRAHAGCSKKCVVQL